MDILVACHVFCEAMYEHDDGARGVRRRVVCACIEGERLGTGKPGFGEVGHGCVRVRVRVEVEVEVVDTRRGVCSLLLKGF